MGSCLSKSSVQVEHGPIRTHLDEENDAPLLSERENAGMCVPELSDDEGGILVDEDDISDSNMCSDRLIDSLDGYNLIGQIGQGASSVVYHMEKDGVHYAVKMCDLKKKQVSFLNSDTHKPKEEAAILRKFDHPYVIKMYDIIENLQDDVVFIVMEYLPCGTIMKSTSVDEKKMLFAQALAALEYVHYQRIGHCDIKPDNILIAPDKTVRLCDFGISEFVPENSPLQSHTLKGSPYYSAPEVLRGEPYCLFKADIWAMGITLYQIIFGKLPFVGGNIFHQQQIVENTEISFPEGTDPNLSHLISKMLARDPSERYSITDIWMHKWMSGLFACINQSEFAKANAIFKGITKSDRKNSITQWIRSASRSRNSSSCQS